MTSGRRSLGWGIGQWPRRDWRLVATLALTETTSYGVLAYAFGVFLLPMQQELGWSRTALTGAYSLAIIVSGVAAIPVGRWLDRHGARALMTTGAAAASLLVLAWAQVTDLAAFYATWIGIGLAMAAVLYERAFAVIATWFRDAVERTRALLGLTVIAGFASVIYVPLAGWLVQTLGWRQALVVLATLLAVLTVLPNATLPGRRPDQLDRLPNGQGTIPVAGAEPAGVPLRRALRDQALWWLAAALVAATLATTTVTVHLVTYLREQHYSAGFAATWTGLLGAGSVGRPSRRRRPPRHDRELPAGLGGRRTLCHLRQPGHGPSAPAGPLSRAIDGQRATSPAMTPQ
jgi:MFS family permease